MTDRHTTKPYSLRISDELREQLGAQAKANGRSLNAEIVSRLADSCMQEHSEKFGHRHQPALPGINVIIDSSGYPISWDEITEHLAAIRRAGNFNVVSMQTSVITPDLVSSSEREEESEKLADFYASKRPKRISRSKKSPGSKS